MAGKPKRPSILDAMMDPKAPAEGEPTAAEGQAAAAKPKPRSDIQHTSVYIPRAAHERLREIAFHERVKIHDLIMEGIDLAIQKRGHVEKASRDPKDR